jgi:hypothetical protein
MLRVVNFRLAQTPSSGQFYVSTTKALTGAGKLADLPLSMLGPSSQDERAFNVRLVMPGYPALPAENCWEPKKPQ